MTRRAKHALLHTDTRRLDVQPGMTGSLLVYDRPLTADEAKYAVLRCPLELRYADGFALRALWLPAPLGLLSGLAFALFYVTFAVPIARLADSGSQFSARVSNSAGSVTSNAAALTAPSTAQQSTA